MGDLHPHLFLNYQFCRDVESVSASKPVCRPPLPPPFLLHQTVDTAVSFMMLTCMMLTDGWLSLQHHKQSEQKLSC